MFGDYKKSEDWEAVFNPLYVAITELQEAVKNMAIAVKEQMEERASVKGEIAVLDDSIKILKNGVLVAKGRGSDIVVKDILKSGATMQDREFFRKEKNKLKELTDWGVMYP